MLNVVREYIEWRSPEARKKRREECRNSHVRDHYVSKARKLKEDILTLAGDPYQRHIRFRWMKDVQWERKRRDPDLNRVRRMIGLIRSTRIWTGDHSFKWNGEPLHDACTRFLAVDAYESQVKEGRKFFEIDLSPKDGEDDPRWVTRLSREFIDGESRLGGAWGAGDYMRINGGERSLAYFERRGDLLAVILRFPDLAFLPNGQTGDLFSWPEKDGQDGVAAV